MRYIIYTFLIIIVASISSCRKDFNTVPSFGNLEFSKDTVFLDTIFTNIGSSTYNLKVYNRGNNAITIPGIRLENGTSSNYRLNVDGMPGKEFSDIDILAKDSIFVFVETTTDVGNALNLLYTDRILFDTGANQQVVDLVTLVQDANFIFLEKETNSTATYDFNLEGSSTSIESYYLTDNQLSKFTNTKPTVVYGYATVPKDKTLSIAAGSKIYFHNNSGLIVDNKGTLKVNGTLSEKVIFEGDRLEYSFSDTAGQWGFIWLRQGSKNNQINHAIIKNGTIGILVDATPSLKINNSEIYNHSNYGLLGRKTNIEGHNLVLGAAGKSSLAITGGGTYTFAHSTFANFWDNSLRQSPTVFVNNFEAVYENDGLTIEAKDLHAANFTNCIFDGKNTSELFLYKEAGTLFNYNISNCLIKASEPNNDPNYQNNIFNGNAHFRNPQKNDFIIGEVSDARNKAKASLFSTDILGIDRSTSPDIGAYQHITFEKEE